MAIESGVERRRRLEQDINRKSARMTGQQGRQPADPIEEILGLADSDGKLERALGEANEKRQGRLIEHGRWVLGHQIDRNDPFAESVLMQAVPGLSELNAQRLVREARGAGGKE